MRQQTIKREARAKPEAQEKNGEQAKTTAKAETKKQRRERLLTERQSSSTELARLQQQMKTEIEHDTEEGDPDVYEREKLLAVIRALEDKIESLNYALKALDAGHYGFCERCGNEIGTERLKAMPGTTLCVKCKAETERLLRRGFGNS
ncbi:MAG: TraR/DksA C4-type zinc finger protein [Chloroflexi bacterium]|nr:TraR/DksA C4-type zinc finger protein [Chloroflexota bacterium]